MRKYRANLAAGIYRRRAYPETVGRRLRHDQVQIVKLCGVRAVSSKCDVILNAVKVRRNFSQFGNLCQPTFQLVGLLCIYSRSINHSMFWSLNGIYQQLRAGCENYPKGTFSTSFPVQLREKWHHTFKNPLPPIPSLRLPYSLRARCSITIRS
jgi:hypothetical protein